MTATATGFKMTFNCEAAYLHATVIDDYVLIFDFGVQLRHLRTALKKESVP